MCFDPVGGDLFDAALSALGWGGRILLVGFVGGVQQIPANRLLVKNRAALGCSLRYFRWHAPDKLRRSVDELLALVRGGQAPAVRHATGFPLEQSVGGHPAPDRSQGARQGRRRSGAAGELSRSERGWRSGSRSTARHVAIITIDNQPRRNAMSRPDDGGAGPAVGRARALALPLHRPHRRRRQGLQRRRRPERRSLGAAGDGPGRRSRAPEAAGLLEADRRRRQRRLRGRRRRAAALHRHPRGRSPRPLRAARGAGGRSIRSAAPPSSSSSRSATSTPWISC